MVALSLWKVVCCRDFCYSNGWQPSHYGTQPVVEILVAPMDGSLVIMEGSLSLRFLLLQWMVPLSLWKVIYCSDFYYSNGWQPCNYGRQSIVEKFFIPLDGSMLSRFFLLQWIVALSLCKVFCSSDFYYSNGWQLCHYRRQSIVEIYVTQMDGSLVIMECSMLSIFLLFLWMVALSL